MHENLFFHLGIFLNPIIFRVFLTKNKYVGIYDIPNKRKIHDEKILKIGGIGVFIISERKRKKDEGQGQSGIDPSRLRAASTSTGAGGYKTNRGESYLDDESYEKTRSVYDQPQVEEKQDDQPTSSKGSMPKGWKPE